MSVIGDGEFEGFADTAIMLHNQIPLNLLCSQLLAFELGEKLRASNESLVAQPVLPVKDLSSQARVLLERSRIVAHTFRGEGR